MARVHVLKTWPEQFRAITDGIKTHEVRDNDRGFRVGDYLRLREYELRRSAFTGRDCYVLITYISDNEAWCKTGFVVMSVSLAAEPRTEGDDDG